jgi:hypothetical protein
MVNQTNWNRFFFSLGTTKTRCRVNDTVNKAKCACVYNNIKRVQIKWITSTLNYVLLSPPPGRCFSHCILIKNLLSGLDIPAPWVRAWHMHPMYILFYYMYVTRFFEFKNERTSNVALFKSWTHQVLYNIIVWCIYVLVYCITSVPSNGQNVTKPLVMLPTVNH